MNLQEQLYRIKEMMGINTDECYPSDYEVGKEYERDILSKIFSCIAGVSKFPVEGVKEWMFPLVPPNKNNPVHHSPIYDPKNMDMGIWSVTEFEPFVIEKREDKYKDKYKWDEGWNRLIAMVRLYNENKIPRIEGKAWLVYRID